MLTQNTHIYTYKNVIEESTILAPILKKQKKEELVNVVRAI